MGNQRTRPPMREAMWRDERVGLRPIVRELQRDPEVMLLDGCDGLLQVVLALAEHADLVALDLRLDLQPARLDELRDLFRLLVADARQDRDGLSNVSFGGRVDLTFGERLQGDVALDRLLLEDLQRRLQAILRRGSELDRRVILRDIRLRPLEIEPRRELALGLVDGVP